MAIYTATRDVLPGSFYKVVWSQRWWGGLFAII